MQELENFLWPYRTYNHHHPNITATTFGDCANKVWYRVVMSNLLLIDYQVMMYSFLFLDSASQLFGSPTINFHNMVIA